MVKTLLEANSSKNHIQSLDHSRSTALMYACIHGHADVVDTLIQAYPSANHLYHLNRYSQSARELAEQNGHEHVVKVLQRYK